jgi:hypothetical protein
MVFLVLVLNKIRLSLRENRALNFEWDCQFCTEHHKGNLLKKISDVKLEYNLGKCQPDIALLDAHENVHAVIEVVVTHKPEEQAVKFYKDNDIILIEHVLKSDLDLLHQNKV